MLFFQNAEGNKTEVLFFVLWNRNLISISPCLFKFTHMFNIIV